MRVRLRYLTCKLDLPLQADTARKKTTAFEILKTIKVRALHTEGIEWRGTRGGAQIFS